MAEAGRAKVEPAGDGTYWLTYVTNDPGVVAHQSAKDKRLNEADSEDKNMAMLRRRIEAESQVHLSSNFI